MRLVTADLVLLDAALDRDEALASALGCDVADGWNGYPGALAHARERLAADPASARWGTRFFLHEEPVTLVGWGGFKGAPRGGVVELGYEIAPAWRGRGLATAATRALVQQAWSDAGVEAIIAHTLDEPGPSQRVLDKAGFRFDAEVPEEQVGTAWRFRLVR